MKKVHILRGVIINGKGKSEGGKGKIGISEKNVCIYHLFLVPLRQNWRITRIINEHFVNNMRKIFLLTLAIATLTACTPKAEQTLDPVYDRLTASGGISR